MARMWELHVRGEPDALRDAYSRFLLMRNLNQQIPGADLFVMRKRGMFKTYDDEDGRRGGVESKATQPHARGDRRDRVPVRRAEAVSIDCVGQLNTR